jgi:hypothetical protein
MREIKTMGYKIMFSTSLSHNEIEEQIDQFLSNVDARQMVAHAEEMSAEEIKNLIQSY